MSQTHGTEGSVKNGSDAVGEVLDWYIDESSETIQNKQPTTSTPNPALTNVAGPTSWSGSLNCVWDDGDTAQAALTVGATGTINVYPEGETTGDGHWSGAFIVTSIGNSGSQSDNVKTSFSIQGSGALTKGTVPAP